MELTRIRDALTRQGTRAWLSSGHGLRAAMDYGGKSVYHTVKDQRRKLGALGSLLLQLYHVRKTAREAGGAPVRHAVPARPPGGPRRSARLARARQGTIPIPVSRLDAEQTEGVDEQPGARSSLPVAMSRLEAHDHQGHQHVLTRARQRRGSGQRGGSGQQRSGQQGQARMSNGNIVSSASVQTSSSRTKSRTSVTLPIPTSRLDELPMADQAVLDAVVLRVTSEQNECHQHEPGPRPTRARRTSVRMRMMEPNASPEVSDEDVQQPNDDQERDLEPRIMIPQALHAARRQRIARELEEDQQNLSTDKQEAEEEEEDSQ